MKKLTLIALAAITATFVGCKDGGKNSKENGPKTPEENKLAIQNTAVDMVNQFGELEATPSVQASISLAFVLESDADIAEDDAEPVANGRLEGLSQVNKSILAFSTSKISMSGFANQPTRLSSTEEESLQSLFDDYKGVYEWNAETEDWETVTEGGSVVQLKFPAQKDGTSNNAILTLKSYEGVEISSPIEDEYSGDLPSSLAIELTIDDTKEMEYTFDIDYNSNGEPSNLQTSLLLNPFRLSYSFTNNTSKVANSASFTNGDITVLGASYALEGDFSEESITAVEEDDQELKNVLQSGTFSYTMMNLELSGEIDVPSFYDAVYGINMDAYSYSDEIDATEKAEVEAAAETLEAALNEHTTLTLKYKDSGAKAADVEWKTYTDTYLSEFYSEIYVEIGANMVFADESKVDLEDYLTTGFDQLEGALNDLIDQFAESIDEDLDHIDFDDL